MLTPRRFAFFDGMRGIAAAVVVMRHSEVFWGGYPFRSYLAVDLFFVISGFVLANAAEDRLRNGALTWATFMRRRIIRLYPLYFLSMVLAAGTVVAVVISRGAAGTSALASSLAILGWNALFLPAVGAAGTAFFPFNGPAWSLMFELAVNAVYAPAGARLSDGALRGLLVVSGLVLIVAAWNVGTVDAGFLWGGWSVLTGTARAIVGFFGGVLAWRHAQRQPQMPGSIGPGWISFVLAAGVLLTPSAGRLADLAIDVGIVLVGFPLAVAIMARPTRTPAPAMFDRIGRASYPIYVLHAPLAVLLEMLTRGQGYPPFGGVAFLLAVGVIAALVEQRVDLPLRRRWLGERGASARASAAACSTRAR